MRKNTSISLGDHFVRFIDTRVQSGRYGSANGVVRTGLRLLEEHEGKVKAFQGDITEVTIKFPFFRRYKCQKGGEAVMNNGRKTVIRQVLASTTALAFISSSVHAQNEPGLEDDPYMKFRVGNITIGGPLRGMTTEERRQNLISIIYGFGDRDAEVPVTPEPEEPEVPVAPPPPVVQPPVSPTLPPKKPDPPAPATWRTEEFNNQYGLGLIGVEHRYAAGATGQGTLGVIYDSGIDLLHSDVGGIRLSLSHSYYGNLSDTGIDKFGTGAGHGTAVFGVAGARRNGTGIHGVAPDAEFMILKQSSRNRIGDDSNSRFADALKRAIDAGADAMNNSWGGRAIAGLIPEEMVRRLSDPILKEQLRRAAQSGLSIVFATGNDDNPSPSYYAGIPIVFPELAGNLIAVTGLNEARDIQSALIRGSRCGKAMNWCLAAPSITTVLKVGGGTEIGDGTSYAAPHVTGAILVLKGEFPELTTPQIHQILFDTAYDLGDPGVDAVYGHGALDLRNAQAPQGEMQAELGELVDQATIPLSESWITESPVTGGILAAALSDQRILVTDRYDRGYFARLGPRITPASFSNTSVMQAGLGAAFTRTSESRNKTGFGLWFDAFGAGHDVTRIAHMDPVMTLVSQTAGTGFSMRTPIGKATFSMASMITPDSSAVSLGAGLPFGEGHGITISVGHAKETDSILGASVHGAFAGLNSETLYGRMQADFALGEKVTLNGSAAVGHTSFNGTGLLSNGRADTLAMAFGLTFSDALADGDKLSLALARPLAVSGGQVTLRSGTGISSVVANQRTDRIDFAEVTIPLKAADRAPELHLGYMHGFDAGWADAALAFGGVARIDGGAKVMAARAELVFKF